MVLDHEDASQWWVIYAVADKLGPTARLVGSLAKSLLEGDLDEIMDRHDVSSAAESRPERVLGEVVDLLLRTETLGTQGLSRHPREDSNLQPTD